MKKLDARDHFMKTSDPRTPSNQLERKNQAPGSNFLHEHLTCLSLDVILWRKLHAGNPYAFHRPRKEKNTHHH